MPYYNRDPIRDHNFDHYPYKDLWGLWEAKVGLYRDNGNEKGSYFLGFGVVGVRV